MEKVDSLQEQVSNINAEIERIKRNPRNQKHQNLNNAFERGHHQIVHSQGENQQA